MTNTIFFRVLRDDESIASSSSSRLSERDFSIDEALPRYSRGLGKAFFALWQRIRPSRGTTQTTHTSGTGTTYNVDERVENEHVESGQVFESSNLRSISFDQLRIATTGFGRASLGDTDTIRPVFRGWIDYDKLTATEPGRGTAVVIKRFTQKEDDTKWEENAIYLSRLYHPNLVKFVGYCLKDEHRLLVSEFMPQGSLEDHLFGAHSFFKPLSLSLRMKVASGAAKGLAFLHNAETAHGDFKPSNILLDLNYNAKLSDFGFAKEAEGDRWVETIYGDVVFGHDYLNEYTAPESVRTGELDAKSDVYSFGVVLLEMLLGRQVVQKKNHLGLQFSYVQKAKMSDSKLRGILGPFGPNWNEHGLLNIIKKRIEGSYLLKGVYVATLVASLCLFEEASNRPTMDDVVQVLEKLVTPRILAENLEITWVLRSRLYL